MTITLDIDDETLKLLEEQAHEEGLPEARDLAERVLRERAHRHRDPKWQEARQAVEQMKGTATRGLTADEIMAETRGEA